MRSIVCLLCVLCLSTSVWAVPLSHSARDVFSRLPESIFENTPEGLDTAEKQELLEKGSTAFWEVTADTEYVFEVTALPFRSVAVRLHVFHYADQDEILVAIGTRGTPICTMELWKEDINGRIVPIDPPVEPSMEDFFVATPQVQGEGVKPNVLMCVGNLGLEANVIFWNENGMLAVPTDNDVRYRWDGRFFQKYIVSRHVSTEAISTRMVVKEAATPAEIVEQEYLPSKDLREEGSLKN